MSALGAATQAAHDADAGYWAGRTEAISGLEMMHPARLACYPAAYRRGYAAGFASVTLAPAA